MALILPPLSSCDSHIISQITLTTNQLLMKGFPHETSNSYFSCYYCQFKSSHFPIKLPACETPLVWDHSVDQSDQSVFPRPEPEVQKGTQRLALKAECAILDEGEMDRGRSDLGDRFITIVSLMTLILQSYAKRRDYSAWVYFGC